MSDLYAKLAEPALPYLEFPSVVHLLVEEVLVLVNHFVR